MIDSGTTSARARYLAGGPIADSRVVTTDDDNVTFMARAGEVTGGERKQIPFTLSQVEFTRRWSLHVLPSGFPRTRRYGGWSNTKRKRYLKEFARQLVESGVAVSVGATDISPLEDPRASSEWDPSEEAPSTDSPAIVEIKVMPCKLCGCSLIPHSVTSKSSWMSVMNSRHRPNWYQRR